VDVAVAVRSGEVHLSVRDTGPGLAPEDAARIFERFFRADSSRTRAAGGTGLGLSIVAALVAAHGGQVGVDTALGAGATFWVRLPQDREVADQEPPEVADQEPPEAADQEPSEAADNEAAADTSAPGQQTQQIHRSVTGS
jgi:two-component system OmpR family sensor kinase